MDTPRTFRNPFMEYNFIRLTETGGGKAVCALEPRPESLNPYGFVHGGAIYTIADDVAGYAAHTDGNQWVTQNSTVHFLSNQSGGVLTGTAEVRHRGRRTCLVDVTITGDAGRLIAAGSFVYYRVELPFRTP